MHYIRFLKPPKIEIQKPWATIKTLITITTDLGDDFLSAKLPIYAHLILDGDEPTRSKKPVLATAGSIWKLGSRTLWLETSKLPIPALKNPVRLLIGTSPEYIRPLQIHHATMDYLPEVLHAWSSPLDLANNGTMNWVERRFTTSETVTMRICEETGESIARHVWDAGVTLAAFVRDILLLPRLRDDDFPFARKLRKPSGPRAIELGSGCGIVGLQLAHASPNAQVLLTDLPEAMEVLERNISIATLAPESRVEQVVLDWDEDVPEGIAEQAFDLVLVSDCTYNSDSIPALVWTLAFLVERSPEALVVVSMKVRHDSEEVFHEIMAKVGLRQCHRWMFELDVVEQEGHRGCDTVYVYAYQSKETFVQKVRDDDEEE